MRGRTPSSARSIACWPRPITVSVGAGTGWIWLGLTIGCCQCHNHKFDPISQREYYQFFAFFNNQDEPKLSLGPADQAVAPSARGRRGTPQSLTTMVLQERAKLRETHLL